MTGDSVVPTEIDQGAARAWIEDSLQQGDGLSTALLAKFMVWDGRVRALVSPHVAAERLTHFGDGRVTKEQSPEKALVGLVRALVDRGGRTLVVEDDVRRRDDRYLTLHLTKFPYGFVGDRLLHWLPLNGPDEVDQAHRILKVGAAGYPRNAAISTRAPHELGLILQSDMPTSVCDAIAETTTAIIVAAYDAVSYLVWERHLGDEGARES